MLRKSEGKHEVKDFTFVASLSLMKTDLSWPLSSKNTSRFPSLSRSPTASVLMERVLPVSISTLKSRKKIQFSYMVLKQQTVQIMIKLHE